jgi:hypothetical protein
MTATFVSVWDDRREIRTMCNFNPENRKVSDIQATEEDIEDLEVLIEEYVELPGGSIVNDFLIDDGDDDAHQVTLKGVMVYQPSFESSMVRERLRPFEYYTSRGVAASEWPGVEIVEFDVDSLEDPYLIDKH